jgi:hypothetical protein
MTASVSQILKLHDGDLSVRLLRQNVPRFNTVVIMCWSLVMRETKFVTGTKHQINLQFFVNVYISGET